MVTGLIKVVIAFEIGVFLGHYGIYRIMKHMNGVSK